ncbi:MAG: redoxin domain-containing protein, partial [Bacteroidota bacterium]
NRKLENPNITVNVNGLPAGGEAILIGFFADQRFKADSTMVGANGQMSFQRAEPYNPGFYFLLMPNNSAVQMLIDADQSFTMTTQLNDLVGSMEVDGSLDNELLYSNLKFEAQLQPQFQQIGQQLQSLAEGTPEYQQVKQQQEALLAQRKAHLDGFFNDHPNAFFTKFKFAGQNPEVRDIRLPNGELDNAAQVYSYRTEMWDNVDFSDKRLLYTPVIANKLEKYIKELTSQNPDSINASATFLADKALNYPEYYKFFVNYVVLNYEPTKTTLMDPEAVYTYMIQKYFTYDRAFWSDSTEVYALQLRANEMAGSIIGKKAPNVEAVDVNGQMRSIDEIKAPYIVVYMYNPTCEHCMEQTPKLVSFYQEWKNKGVEVFGIAIDTDDKEWKDYVRKTGMTWPSVYDPTNRAIYGKYYVDITPEIYVINPERKIIAKNLKVSQIGEVIMRDQEG